MLRDKFAGLPEPVQSVIAIVFLSGLIFGVMILKVLIYGNAD